MPTTSGLRPPSSEREKDPNGSPKKARWPSAWPTGFRESCFLFAGTGGTTTAFAFAFTALSSTLTSFAALSALRAASRRLRPVITLEGGSSLRATATAAKSSTAVTAPHAATAAATESWEAREQFSVGQLAVLVFVQLLERGRCCLDFLGGDFAVTVRVERSHDWEHPHEPARATGTTRRAAESTAGTTRTAGGASRKSASSAAATEPAGLRSA